MKRMIGQLNQEVRGINRMAERFIPIYSLRKGSTLLVYGVGPPKPPIQGFGFVPLFG